MQAMNEHGYVTYCRFGRDYISHLARQSMNLINNPNLSQPMRQIATYLINVKKLVKDHNIESESKDFNKLDTRIEDQVDGFIKTTTTTKSSETLTKTKTFETKKASETNGVAAYDDR